MPPHAYPVQVDEVDDGDELAIEGVRRQVDEADTAQFDVALRERETGTRWRGQSFCSRFSVEALCCFLYIYIFNPGRKRCAAANKQWEATRRPDDRITLRGKACERVSWRPPGAVTYSERHGDDRFDRCVSLVRVPKRGRATRGPRVFLNLSSLQHPGPTSKWYRYESFFDTIIGESSTCTVLVNEKKTSQNQ